VSPRGNGRQGSGPFPKIMFSRSETRGFSFNARHFRTLPTCLSSQFCPRCRGKRRGFCLASGRKSFLPQHLHVPRAAPTWSRALCRESRNVNQERLVKTPVATGSIRAAKPDLLPSPRVRSGKVACPCPGRRGATSCAACFQGCRVASQWTTPGPLRGCPATQCHPPRLPGQGVGAGDGHGQPHPTRWPGRP